MKKIFQVSEFNEFINTYLEQVGDVVVEGELSEIRVSRGKWLFATIKDKESNVEVFGMTFKLSGYDLLEPGMLVQVHGTPRLYKKTGRFNIFADQIVPAGEGAFKLVLEKLKLKLEKEGLFDTKRKRSLPIFPENIGLVTAKGSRAYSDFVKVLKNRMGGLKIHYYPVSVQGKDSVQTILAAFKHLNKQYPELDLIVLARGGGSLEDLQSFNNEKIARAIFSSKIPVVCAIGHEEDVSIVDLVADVRASTPSNAAELIVRDRAEVVREIDSFIKSVDGQLQKMVKEKSDFVLGQVNILRSAINKEVLSLHRVITKFSSQFNAFSKEINILIKEITDSKRKLIRMVGSWLVEYKNSLGSLTRLLKSLDFRQVLKRGFSITVDKSGVVMKSISKVKKGQEITTTLYDGKIGSRVLGIKK